MPDKGHRSPEPSWRVANLLDMGWTSAANGLAAIQWWHVARRSTEGESQFLDLYAGDRHVQVYISPTGRAVRVYVDGQES